MPFLPGNRRLFGLTREILLRGPLIVQAISAAVHRRRLRRRNSAPPHLPEASYFGDQTPPPWCWWARVRFKGVFSRTKGGRFLC